MLKFSRVVLARLGFAPAAIALTLLVSGCGGTAASAPEKSDERLVSDVVEDFNEARQSTKKSLALFAKGAMPAKAEFKKYATLSFWPNAGAATVSGDAATI